MGYSIFKSVALGIAVIAIIGLGQSVARADEVFFQGSTGGCFGAGCTPATTGTTNTATLLGLTYRGSGFDGTTVAGFLGIGEVPVPGANNDNLGSFTLVPPTSGTSIYTGSVFRLVVTFTAPPGITGCTPSSTPCNPQTFNATLEGAVSATEGGGLNIDFVNTPITFTFSNANASGSFQFFVNDVAIQGANSTVAVTGFIRSAVQNPIPEPTSMLLLGTGLVGVAGAVRRKLRARNLT